MRKDDDEELYEGKISWFRIWRGRRSRMRRRIPRRAENEAKEQKKE